MVVLDNVRIRSYRSCRDSEFAPHPKLSVLIGPNGSGKTNVLAAVGLLKLLLGDDRPRYRPQRYVVSGPTTQLRSTFLVDGSRVVYTAELAIQTDEHNSDLVRLSDEKWYSWDLTDSRRRFRFPLALLASERGGYWETDRAFPLSHHYHPLLRRARRLDDPSEFPAFRDALLEIAWFVSGFRYYSATRFADPTKCPISFEVEADGRDRRGIRVRGHQRFLFDMYTTYREDEEKYVEFLTLVDGSGVGLVDSIGFEEVKVASSEYNVMVGGRLRERSREKLLVIPQFRVGKNTLSPSQLSEGTFKTLALLFYLVTDQGSLLMLEEPEVCVHHGLLTSIVELISLYSREKQIILTTHSDAVLDQLSDENVFAVTNDRSSGTSVKSLSSYLGRQDLSALREYLRTDGTLGEFWRRGGLEDSE